MKTPLSRISIGVTCAEVWDPAQLSLIFSSLITLSSETRTNHFPALLSNSH